MRVNIGREGRTSSSLSSNGGAMLGSLILANGPSQPLEAATKYYVDTVFSNLNANNVLDGILPISSLPGFTGDAISSQGSNSFVLSNLGVNPGSYSKVIVDAKGRITGNDVLSNSDIPNFNWDKVTGEPNTLAGYGINDALSMEGGTLTGNLSVATPSQAMSIVNKQYADSALNNNSASLGDIIRKCSSTTPVGFLRCNGGLVSKTLYSDLYSVIGDTFNINSTPGSGQPWRQQYDINSTQSGDITGWATGTALPVANGQAQAIVTKNRVYLLGGGSGLTPTSTVYTAVINADGTLGTWVTDNPLPAPLIFSHAVVTNNRVYLIGGYTTGGVTVDTVYTASINTDGTLNSWFTSTSLPEPCQNSQAIIVKNRIYLLATSSATGMITTIYTTTVNTDGTLNTWTTAGNLPILIGRSQIITTKNRVYILGGTDGTLFLGTILTAPINSDGTLGEWVISNLSLSTPVYYARAYVTKNRVYLFGGKTTATTSTAIVQSAPINADGTLGGWSAATSLPAAVSSSHVIVTKNRIYLLGGWTGNATSSAVVYTALISSSIQDYSGYYDGSIVPLDSTDQTKFALPDFSSKEKNGAYIYMKY